MVAQDGSVYITFSGSSGTCKYTSSSGIVSYNQWQQLVVSFDGSGFDIYVNGELAQSSGTVCSGKTPPSLTSLYIGRPNDHGYLYAYYLDHDKAYDGDYWDWGCGLAGCLRVDRQDENKLEMEGTKVWSANTEDDKDYSIQIGRIIGDSSTHIKLYDEDDLSSNEVYINQQVNNTSLRALDGQSYGWQQDGNNFTCQSKDSCGYLWWSLSNDFFEGKLDDFRIYNYGLSAGQVADLYKATFSTLAFSVDEPPGKSVLEDESGNGLDLGCTESANTCPDTGIPGRDNQALRFDGGVADDDGHDGAADYLSVPDDNRLDLEADTTIALWVKADNWNNNQYTPFLVKGSGSNANYYLGKSSNNRLVFAYRDSGNTWREQTLSLSAYDTGGWLHIAAVVEPDSSTQVTLYVNGNANGPYTLSGTPKTNGNGLTIGRYLSSSHAAFDGLMDELVMLPFALNASQIADLVNDAPLLNLHLDEDSTTTGFVDDSPAANHVLCSSAATCPSAGDKGQIREAAHFDGSDLLTDSANAESSLTTFSLGLWIKPTDATGAPQYLIERGNGSRYNYRVWMNTDSFTPIFDLHASGCGSTLYQLTANTVLLQDQWNYLAATYDGNTMRLYVNGALSNSRTTGNRSACTSSGHSLSIGKDFVGNLDELTLYGSALDADDIVTAYDYQSAWYDVAEQHALVVDADTPTVYLDLASPYLSATLQTLSIYAHDDTSGIDSVDYRVDGGVWTAATASDESWVFNYTATAPGSHTVAVRATDRVGFAATGSHTVIVDDSAPVLGVDASLTGAVGGVTSSLVLSGTATDDTSGIAAHTLHVSLGDHSGNRIQPADPPTLNGDIWQAIQSFANVPPYGVYTLTVSAEDTAGNASVISERLWLDGYAPVADLINAGKVISGSGAILTGTVADLVLPVQSKQLALHFEEVGGVTRFVDATTHRSTATCTDCPAQASDGRFGSARAFAVGDTLTLTNTDLVSTTLSQFLGLNSDFTVLAWVRADAWNGSQPVLQNDGSGDNQALFLGVQNGAPVMDFGNNRLSGDSLPAGTWVHVAWRYRTLDDLEKTIQEQALFVNGVQVAVDQGSTTFAGDGTFTIGGGNAFDLDEVTVYNRALRDDNIYYLANPLATSVVSVEIRYRHAKDKDLADSAGEWYTADLADPNRLFSTWSHTVPGDTEGPHRVDLRTTDSVGNVRTYVSVWDGEIDVLPPRLTFTYALLGNGYARVHCAADDFNIADDRWECPAANRTDLQADAAWFVEIFDSITKTVEYTTALENVQITAGGSGGISSSSASNSMTACDAVGQCTTTSVASPVTLGEVSAILTPTHRAKLIGLDSITIEGYAKSPNQIRQMVLTVNGSPAYTETWPSGITEAYWQTSWQPAVWGDYHLEAILTTGSGSTVLDAAETTLIIDAPELRVEKFVTPDDDLRYGDSVTYTFFVSNTGTLDATGVRITDTLPAGISGVDLDTTVDLAVGERISFTIPATITNRTAFTLTNTAWVSHTWERVGGSASLDVCDVELVVNANDSGPGSLRDKLDNEICGTAYVTFADDFDIYLDSTLALDDSRVSALTMDGRTQRVTISGDSDNDGDRDVRPFEIAASGTVTLSNLNIVSGTAKSAAGILNQGTLVIIDSTLRDHQTLQSRGNRGSGGIISNEGSLEIMRSTLSEGHAGYYGGGIYNTGSLTVSQSVFADFDTEDLPRAGQYGYGGAIANRGALNMTESILRGSVAEWGGGLYNMDGGTAILDQVLVQANEVKAKQAYGGGGVYNRGVLTVTNSTFLSNTTSARYHGGGGLFNGGTATVIHSTFVGNHSVANGSALYSYIYANLTLFNSLLVDNVGGVDCFEFVDSIDPVAGGNVIGSVNGWAASRCQINAPTEALRGALDNWGAARVGDSLTEPLITYALLPGSPALNSGDPAYCAAADLRGVARPVGDGCDAGAWESRGFTLTVNGGDNQTALINEIYSQPLSVSVAAVAADEALAGGVISFTASGEDGAQVSLHPVTVTLTSSGIATTTATANGISGGVMVTATASGVITPVVFALTNLAPDLAISKAVNARLIPPGQPITYTLRFTNSGNTPATGVVISDTVGRIDSPSYVSSGVIVTQMAGSAFAWAVDDLPPARVG